VNAPAHAAPPTLAPAARARRWAEFLALYAGIPALLWAFARGRPVALPVLWSIALVVGLCLRRDPSFDRSVLRRWRADRRAWRRIVLRFILSSAAMAALVAWRLPGHLLDFPRQRPDIWALVVVLYPLLSVYPQGLLARVLFVHRYGALFPSSLLRRLAGAAAFSLMHTVFNNPWAMGLTFAGGWFFLDTYERTRSQNLASLEHGLYGDAAFTLGFGRFFYNGTRAVVESMSMP
jgi:hypothetical protein